MAPSTATLAALAAPLPLPSPPPPPTPPPTPRRSGQSGPPKGPSAAVSPATRWSRSHGTHARTSRLVRFRAASRRTTLAAPTVTSPTVALLRSVRRAAARSVRRASERLPPSAARRAPGSPRGEKIDNENEEAVCSCGGGGCVHVGDGGDGGGEPCPSSPPSPLTGVTVRRITDRSCLLGLSTVPDADVGDAVAAATVSPDAASFAAASRAVALMRLRSISRVQT